VVIQARGVRRRLIVRGVVLSVFLLSVALLSVRPVLAEGEVIEGGSPVTARVNHQVAVNDISIDGTGNDVLPVQLSVSHGSLYLADITGLTLAGSRGGPVVEFSGTRADVNAALASLRYTGTAVGNDTLTVTIAQPGQVFNPENGHVYEYINRPGGYTWVQARDEAASKTYEGIPGYLATITSQSENDFIQTKLAGDAWLGATDTAVEGQWRWATGPENGTLFYTGQGNNGTGAVQSGQYANWKLGEPNQMGDEDCMEVYIGEGTWNDWPCGNTTGYVVEYGTNEELPPAVPTKDVAITVTAAEFAGGDGSAEHPYQVTDCERLQSVNQNLSAHYVLTHNIDCTDTPNWNGGKGFAPIGYAGDEEDCPFTGTLDGAGYTIDGLTIIRADETYGQGGDDEENVGLIGLSNGATIKNVHLTDAMIKGYHYVGGLVGYMQGGTVTNSSVNLNITSTSSDCNGHCIWARYGQYGGGLVGAADGGTISDSASAGPVKGSGIIIGGLVGTMSNGAILEDSTTSSPVDGGENIGGAVGEAYQSTIRGVSASGRAHANLDEGTSKWAVNAGGLLGYGYQVTIERSRASGNVEAESSNAGGIAGQLNGATVSDTYATGDVVSDSNVGGVVGDSGDTTLSRVYASGSIAGNLSVGGLLGSSWSSTINDSFAAGAVDGRGTEYVGGIVGYNGSITMTHTYFGTTATTQAQCANTGAVGGCNGIGTAGYFVNKANDPFTRSGSEVWLGNVWLFDSVNLPVFGTTIVDDGDGISASIEGAAPNHGDGNGDNIPDSEQANVTSFVNPQDGKYITLELAAGCSITEAATIAENATAKDKNYDYAHGLVNFSANCSTSEVAVKLFYHGISTDGLVLRKYKPSKNGGTYFTIGGATLARQLVGTQSVAVASYTITDNGELDLNPAAGAITDPVGLASATGGALAATGVNQIALLAVGGVLVVLGIVVAGWRRLLSL